ncbi:MAG: hypothetical protein JRJ00_18770 [Deltaproteobacteria bacterium]|nr:hypothetical protein [Deltaproteobacteria bacterium]
MYKQRCLVLSIVSIFLMFYTSSLHARDVWMSERICTEIMDQIKSIISTELGKIHQKPYFIQKSSTRIGQITTTIWWINDCVIRSVHGQEQAVIFFYDTNLRTHIWTKDIPSTIQKIKIPALYKGKGECYGADCSEHNLRIGIISRNEELLSNIVEWLNPIDVNKIIEPIYQKHKKLWERQAR